MWLPWLVLASALAAEPAWTPAGAKHGVEVAFRDDERSGVREVRATADLPFAAASIERLVCDFRDYGTLVDGVQEARVISGTVSEDYEIYLRYAPRFMVVAARDVAVRVQRRATDGSGVGCAWANVESREPARKGVVRMPLLRGSWTIQPLGATRARVVYQVAVDPGGRIPGWLVRRGAVGALPDVVEQVRQRLQRGTRPATP